MKMNTIELCKALQNKMVADRETIDEAFEYAHAIAKGSDCPLHVMTAVQVVVNTICKEILKSELVESNS